jgi:Xaa-Pro aminopeptidase
MARTKQPPPAAIARRIEHVRGEMADRKLDAYYCQDFRDQRWLTGFTGEDGAVLITHHAVMLLTDGRFQETAEIEAPFARAIVRKQRGPAATLKLLKQVRARRIGYNAGHVSAATLSALSKGSKPARWIDAADLVTDLREVKDEGEILAIREAIRIAQEAFQAVRTSLKPGFKERDISAELQWEMARRGADSAAFEPIVAAGPNASLPHYRARDRQIRKGELLLIDWGACRDGYVSDLTRVIAFGNIPRELKSIVDHVRKAHDLALKAVRQGVAASLIDSAARAYLTKMGYGKQFTHSVGHGIGLNVHESPGLRRTNKAKLRAGMVVTIEPGVYLPGIGGVRIEDDVLVTKTGFERLSSLPAVFPAVA